MKRHKNTECGCLNISISNIFPIFKWGYFFRNRKKARTQDQKFYLTLRFQPLQFFIKETN